MKNLFKKILACCLVVCMVFTLCISAITVSAEEVTYDGALTIGNAEVAAGAKEATVSFTALAEKDGIAAAEVNVTLPAGATGISKVELVKADENVQVTFGVSEGKPLVELPGENPEDPDGEDVYVYEGDVNIIENVFSYILWVYNYSVDVTKVATTVEITFVGDFDETAPVTAAIEACKDDVDLLNLKVVEGAINVTAAHTHNYVGTETKAATCTEPGVKTFTCTCGEGTYTEPIPVIPHTEEAIPPVDATCTTAGATAGVKCSVCDTVITAPTTVEALGHAWNEGEVTTAPDCDDAGVKTYTCANDPSHTKEEAIDALGHTAAAEKVKKDEVAATCTTDGSYRDVVVCEVCGAEISSETITVKALGHKEVYTNNGDNHTVTCSNGCDMNVTEDHSFVDGECVCGAVEVVETPVDPNLKPNFTLIQLSETVNVQYIYILPKEYDDFRLEVSAKGYDAKNKFAPCDKEMRVFDTEHYTQAVPTSNYYELIYTGIGMYEMDMEVTAVLYVLKDGKEVAKSIPLTCTIAQLALESYNKNLGSSANNKKARNIAVDLLNLGSEVQKYFVKDGKAPSNSVFAKATAEHLPVDVLPEGALENNGSKEYCEFNLVDQTTGSRVMPTILMNASPAFNFVSIIDKKYDAADLTFDVTYESIHLGTCPQTLTGSQLVELGMAAPASGYYESPFDKIALYDSDKVVNFTLTYKKGSAEQNVLLTAQCTVEAYIAKNLNQGKNSDAAFDALAKFVTSAHANWPDY